MDGKEKEGDVISNTLFVMLIRHCEVVVIIVVVVVAVMHI